LFHGVALNNKGKEVFLRDIWPTREEIQAVERQFVIPAMFKEVYEKIEVNSTLWILILYDSPPLVSLCRQVD
jgi:aconitase A